MSLYNRASRIRPEPGSGRPKGPRQPPSARDKERARRPRRTPKSPWRGEPLPGTNRIAQVPEGIVALAPWGAVGCCRRGPHGRGRPEVVMKLTRASSYALHAVAHMAQQKAEKPMASHVIAEDRDIP